MSTDFSAKTLYYMSLLLFVSNVSLTNASKQIFNVINYGAKADGKTDSTKAFLDAWMQACKSNNPATMYVPPGKYLLLTLVFKGPCNSNNILLRIDGTLVAHSDWRLIGNASSWISFRLVDGVSVSGGLLDGRGTSLWSCKNSAHSSDCPTGAASLGFWSSKNVAISRMKLINSQLFHVVISCCENVRVKGVQISAPGQSPNTDGIHVQFSTGVTVRNSKIATGDDCISIGPGCSNLWVENILCGQGHGISIGSLGWVLEEEGVQNVTVTKVNLTGTTNGFRIKTWGRPTNGFVNNILFQNALMINVRNPIVIDQNYCPNKKNCPGKASGVKISNVTYQGIHGTSATAVGVKLDCSNEKPCSGIRMVDVKLSYKNKVAEATYNNAQVTAAGIGSYA